jgi:hypothetical protein
MNVKERMRSKKKKLILFRAKHCAEKKRIGFKKKLILFRAHIVPKKDECQKKVWVPKKEGTHTISGKTLCQKKYECQKKDEIKKKGELILFWAKHIVLKKVWVSKKKYEFQQKRNSYFFGPTSQKKRMSATKKV